MTSENTDEEYVISRAKELISSDSSAARAWMLTAKTLYPTNFSVQFQAYKIQKSLLKPHEAAVSFCEVYEKFNRSNEMLEEIDCITYALRYATGDVMNEFNRRMFTFIRPDIQKEVLVCVIERTQNVMEVCRVVLILLHRFPDLVNIYVPGLVDKLLVEEEQSNVPTALNCYRKMLVCGILPLVGHSSVTLLPKVMYKLLNKTLEFCLCYVSSPVKDIQDASESESSSLVDPWGSVFTALEIIGAKLQWELAITFTIPWVPNDQDLQAASEPFQFWKKWDLRKEVYWQAIVSLTNRQVSIPEEQRNYKELLYCTAAFFLRCLYEYISCVEPNHSTSGNDPLVLIEAFVVPVTSNIDKTQAILEPEDEVNVIDLPEISVAKAPGLASVKSNFLLSVSCWERLHSMPTLKNEFAELCEVLKLEPMLKIFLYDISIYRLKWDNIIGHLQTPCTQPVEEIRRQLRLASMCYCNNDILNAAEHILNVAGLVSGSNGPVEPVPNILNLPTDRRRHLHFLPVTRPYILHYCVKFLMKVLETQIFSTEIKTPSPDTDLALGHLLVLAQYDWNREEKLALKIFHKISQQRSFTYKFFSYIINLDFLEEFMYICQKRGGGIILDILGDPSANNQRRIATRGADKDVKEAIKNQVKRSRELPDVVITKFLVAENQAILQSLASLVP